MKSITKKVVFGLFTIAFGLILLPDWSEGEAIAGNSNEIIPKGKFAIGLEGGYSERRYKDYSDVDDDTLFEFKGRELTVTRGFLTLTYGILDRLNIYGKLGVADARIEADGTFEDGIPDETDIKMKWKDAFAWGAGIKGRLYDFGKGLSLNAMAGIIGHKHNIDRMTLKDIPSGIEGRIEDIVVLTQWWPDTARATFDANIKFREYLGALYLNKKFTALSLTGGILYSDLKSKYYEKTVGYDSAGNVTGTLIGDEPLDFFKPKRKVGALLGGGYNFREKLFLNIEVQLFDQTSITGGVSYLF